MLAPNTPPASLGRKARRKLSPAQVAFIERKAKRDKAKAERESAQRRDAWYLQNFHPEIAKAKRQKGVENNAKAWAWRRKAFVGSFADWPSVLSVEEMGYRIREWLRAQRKMKWRGCEKHYLDKEASVRKKLTKLGVFRYNTRERVWFKCGEVERVETTQRLGEQDEAACRLEREEAGRLEQERLNAEWDARRQTRERAEQAERDRLSRPADAGWHDFIPEHLKPTALDYFISTNKLSEGQGLDDLSLRNVEWILRRGERRLLDHLPLHWKGRMQEVAEAVLVAD